MNRDDNGAFRTFAHIFTLVSICNACMMSRRVWLSNVKKIIWGKALPRALNLLPKPATGSKYIVRA